MYCCHGFPRLLEAPLQYENLLRRFARRLHVADPQELDTNIIEYCYYYHYYYYYY